ncbi:hypothetical protein B7P43_G16716 [Cryptotermes secundus]|uniref:Uncharacterized protein n=1 Tax=Cryptotermes secundus TaxID=105785 RepID=A0A2J7RD07_9NEOP|nr:hypothetical protein B7P43_G16716 [Cryptotermes secundus]
MVLDTKTDRLTDRQSQCDFDFEKKSYPCGGEVEYLHCEAIGGDEKGSLKSEIRNKIWSHVHRISDARESVLARTRSIYKRQTLPLIREGAPQKQNRNCQRVINGARHQDLLTD